MIRELSNGYIYEVTPNFLGGYNLYYRDSRSENFKRSTRSFKSLEEAKMWFDSMEANYIAEKSRKKEVYTMPASAYFSITGYYGD